MSDTDTVSKKRKLNRACDVCRKKKIRCNGGQTPDGRCSNCVAFNYVCSYVEGAKRRDTHSSKYVEALENRLKKMEKLLKEIRPSADLSELTGDDSLLAEVNQPGLSSSSSAWKIPRTTAVPSISPTVSARASSNEADDDGPYRGDQEYRYTTITDHAEELALDPTINHFMGRSSSIMLVYVAASLKSDHMSDPSMPIDGNLPNYRRSQFWARLPWEDAMYEQARPNFEFPLYDLLWTLVDIFFTRVNPFYPLLHRPTFTQSIQDNLHLRDDGFASVLLLVCAVASRECDDSRVLFEDTDSELSAGWAWFRQVQMVRKPMLAPPILYDLQVYALSVMYLNATSSAHLCWITVGVGMRLAQDVGAHTSRVYSSRPTVESELWRRAFWVLLALDRVASASLGRPCSMADEDIDADWPIECDGQYWEDPDPEKAWKQPQDKPSSMAYFNHFLKLTKIISTALQSIFTLTKTSSIGGFVGNHREQHTVVELDAQLNRWIDAMPDHLRWDPHRENQLFFVQSAILHASYYQLQITIHRPFITSPRNSVTMSFPSLAICTNAARSCCHVVDILVKRTGRLPAQLVVAVFSAALVLLLNIWGGKKSGLVIDPEKEMTDIHKCMYLLKASEKRTFIAGRFWDILCELSSAGDLPLPEPVRAATSKRKRDSDDPTCSVPTGSQNISPILTNDERPRSRRASGEVMAESPPQLAIPTMNQTCCSADFPLPIHSEELGRIPVYPSPDVYSHMMPSANGMSSFNAWGQMGGRHPIEVSHPTAIPSACSDVCCMNAMSYSFQKDDMLGYDNMVPNISHHTTEQYVPRQYQTPMGASVSSQTRLASTGGWGEAPPGVMLDDWSSFDMSRSQGRSR